MGLLKDMVGAGVQSHRGQAINGSVATGLTAAGNNQATGLALTASINVFGTVAASAGAVLPLGRAGDSVTVRNGGANALSVYPPVGGSINGGSTNAAVSVAATKATLLQCVSEDGLTWISLAGA